MLALPESSSLLLAGLEQHRQLTTLQLRAIYAPERSVQSLRRETRLLLRRRLAAFSDRGSSHHRCWYLTKLGAQVMGASRALTDDQAAGPKQGHTLAVNEVGIAFLEAARRRGDGFGPEDWRHEIGHPGLKRRADAVLDYQFEGGLALTFLELDNGTEQVRKVVDKLADYARFRKSDLWERSYRAFPGLLVILAGRPRPQLEARLRMLRFWTEKEPEIGGSALTIRFALLEDLQRRGPFASIFRQPGKSEHLNWLGEADRSLSVVSGGS